MLLCLCLSVLIIGYDSSFVELRKENEKIILVLPRSVLGFVFSYTCFF